MTKCAKRDFLDYRDKEIILKLADCGMSMSETARQLYMHRNTVVYHVLKIKRATGKDPRNFYDLWDLVQVAQMDMENIVSNTNR